MTDNNSRGDSSGEAPPDRAASGDVTTTGHSAHDADGHVATTSGHDTHDDSHDAHGHGGGHGGHGDDSSDVPTIVPTTWRQLIFPVLILLLVIVLVSGPVTNAFQSRPAPLPTNGETHTSTGETGSASPTALPSNAEPTQTSNGSVPTPDVKTTPTTSSFLSQNSPTPDFDVSATMTAVAVAGMEGQVARAPVRLDFDGTSFVVKAGDTLLPDWQPPQDQGIATWIEGSVANHILYVPYSDTNASLFSGAKKGDKMTLLMNTGQLFEFAVTRSERAFNGPEAGQGQLTVTAAMAQDHAGVTLFLIGDTSQDRAVVQADFTGNIQ